MTDTISIYDIHGVAEGATEVVDHPRFPNPRSDQGDLRELARGIARSGRSDTPIVLWQRKEGEKPILLDGKRRVTAWLRFDEVLLDVGLKPELPVAWWKPAANNCMTDEQEAWAFMIRQNSQNIQGRKFLTFEEEVAAIDRLKKSGLNNTKIGDIMGYSREIVSQLLQCKQSLAPNVRKAVTPRDAKPTPEKPLSRRQAVELADKPLADQQDELDQSRKAAEKIERRGKAVTHKAIAKERAAKQPRSSAPSPHASALEAARAAARKAVAGPEKKPRTTPPDSGLQTPDSIDPDKPLSPLEMLEKVLELIRKAVERTDNADACTDLMRARQYGIKLRKEIERLQKEAKRK